MFNYFFNNFEDFLIERKLNISTYFIPGSALKDLLNWYGRKRAEAFKSLSGPECNDIEERDHYFSHMILWDNLNKELIGGQRFLLNKEFIEENLKVSYLESYHPGSYLKLKKYSFCEIGRTFVMPNYQKSKYLIELIRGFVRIPESKYINLGIGLISFDHKNLNDKVIQSFLNILENSKNKFSLSLPKGKYLYEFETNRNTQVSQNNFSYENIQNIEFELQLIDPNFKLPPVLKPYLKYCNIRYEGYSLAKNYNNIIQLLFSGESKNINKSSRKSLKPYKNLIKYN